MMTYDDHADDTCIWEEEEEESVWTSEIQQWKWMEFISAIKNTISDISSYFSYFFE